MKNCVYWLVDSLELLCCLYTVLNKESKLYYKISVWEKKFFSNTFINLNHEFKVFLNVGLRLHHFEHVWAQYELSKTKFDNI